jgi:hypothetical protein
MTFWARSASFQRSGSSACALSSESRLRALSRSKIPPQQCKRLLEVIGDVL